MNPSTNTVKKRCFQNVFTNRKIEKVPKQFYIFYESYRYHPPIHATNVTESVTDSVISGRGGLAEILVLVGTAVERYRRRNAIANQY